MCIRKFIALFLLAGLSLHAARAGTLTGVPEIGDGDTVVIAGEKIRLLDMDAPESDQLCLDQKGEFWECGIAAREALKKETTGKAWECQTTRLDRDKRWLSSCTVDGQNISAWMVREGWALSPTHKGYSHRFDAEERRAREAQAGLWAGAFIAPWDWRRRNCKTEVRGALQVPIDAQRKLCGSPPIPPDPNCTIKATLGRKECIYHVEGQASYGSLQMSGRNKRWFCTTSEAEAAGCRLSKR
ncbi:thermonuclease family protein [Bradyrhizobium jicamae]|uniref:Thermonuclease family protein n=1 Tax=Bradyrhizobium jicamae TaxID=280332 RepID=A0ABS5FPK1_9BRAD|nr:thermonuclease family protein [Bradyrhizobium jicamae]MBR0798727.1 thermonuclease family protein [Bradyrhizobium jicamae]